MKKLVIAGTLLVAGAAGCAGPGVGRPQPVTIATSYTLESGILGQTRRINVYLPPGYATSSARFPVLYLLDKDKRIIAKKVTPEQVEEILAHRLKNQ